MPHSYFHVVVGLAWPDDPESYVGAGVATGRSKVMTQTKRDVLVVDVGGWAWG